jgi:uncharacterized damage-inducible protein DinB
MKCTSAGRSVPFMLLARSAESGKSFGSLDALAVWDGFDQPAPRTIRSASELVRGLETTGQAIQDALARWTLGELDQSFTWEYRDQTSSYTRQRMIWNLVRHDYHHYGEIALTLGRHGLPVPNF